MDDQKYRELVEALLSEVENNSLKPIDQDMEDRAEELVAMANDLKECIRMARAECDRHLADPTKWN